MNNHRPFHSQIRFALGLILGVCLLGSVLISSSAAQEKSKKGGQGNGSQSSHSMYYPTGEESSSVLKVVVEVPQSIRVGEESLKRRKL